MSDIRVLVRFPPEIHADLKATAEASRQSFNATVIESCRGSRPSDVEVALDGELLEWIDARAAILSKSRDETIRWALDKIRTSYMAAGK